MPYGSGWGELSDVTGSPWIKKDFEGRVEEAEETAAKLQ